MRRGRQRRPPAEAAAVRPESGRPVRRFPSYRGQRNHPGTYDAATLDADDESWRERGETMALDHDAGLVGFAAQPFRSFWPDTDRVTDRTRRTSSLAPPAVGAW